MPVRSGFGEHIHRGMGVKGKKVYVVWRGVRSRIFFSWEEYRKQVDGFSGAEH